MSFDEPKLKFNIDLDEIEALNQKRTLAFINHWVYHTVLFLNQFSVICQQKLSTLDSKLRRANDLLSTLESKLSSIPGLENITEEPSFVSNTLENPTKPSDPDLLEDNKEKSGSKERLNVITEDEVDKKSQEAKNNILTIPISSHPDFAPYFKMVNFGVPKEAVKLKMSSVGLDPSLLDDPLRQVESKIDEVSDKSSDSKA
ncbi:WASH complex subunit CCDC53 [Armadillidium nasatum]|uniref:WASH complex subunit CCDC53 n=1 Tax=Armadillidium nasatum TaxID=96803 RepID=A0A5N5SLW0_9CRUS|nr:WASH complex subunit CCDC53 [Armadillidium nasatum]